MYSPYRTLIRGVALAGLVAAWFAFAGTASAATQQPAAAPLAADYAGQDTCLGCHEDKGRDRQVRSPCPGVQPEDAERDGRVRELPRAGQSPRRSRWRQDQDRTTLEARRAGGE